MEEARLSNELTYKGVQIAIRSKQVKWKSREQVRIEGFVFQSK